MTVRPIIFSGAMVAALLSGRKSQTRRLASSPLAKCRPGDLLYVRESFRVQSWDEDGYFWLNYASDGLPSNALHPMDNDAYFEHLTDRLDRAGVPRSENGNYDLAGHSNLLTKPSIHMPRWASRLTLEVTEVRRQRLQDMSEDDAIAEGILAWSESCGGMPDPLYLKVQYGSCSMAFAALWDELHGAEASSANPEIVALTFQVHQQNVDALLARVEGA